MRLDRFLSNSGLGTRKEVKKYIKDGLISVDDIVVSSSAININECKNVVKYCGEVISYHKFYYILLNKPQGYISSTEVEDYPPVTDLVLEYKFANLFPVGRLDVDTTGVLLLTNNGTLCHRLLSPKNHVDKTYFVETDYPIPVKLIKAFKEGIILDGERTLPGELEIISDKTAYLTIHQGKFHQVKRMFAYFDLKVINLERTKFAFLDAEGLNRGEYRLLSDKEIEQLLEI